MTEEKVNSISEWNQQGLFDQAFNLISWECRKSQASRDILKWYTSVESLYIHASPILDDKEKESLNIKINAIRTLVNEYLSLPEMIKRRTSNGNIYSALFDLEQALRSAVHRHNPFLKIKRQVQDFAYDTNNNEDDEEGAEIIASN